MCGIVGYIGSREVSNVLVGALRRLEYRGYDSCSIALMDGGTPRVLHAAGAVGSLEEKLRRTPSSLDPVYDRASVRVGIGSATWACQGTGEDHVHSYRDCSGRFVIVHNGTIENHRALRDRLEARGHRFSTDAAGGVLPHLIEFYFEGDLENAVRRALRDVEGELAVLVISSLEGRQIVAAARQAPLIVGIGSRENFVASDASALLPYTRRLTFLKDGDVARLSRDRVDITDVRGVRGFRRPETMTWSAETAEKEGFPHFMLKEIYDQPRAVRETLAGRLDTDGNLTLAGEIPALNFRRAPQVHIVAGGAAMPAAMIGKFFIERFARIAVHVDCSAEFLYREPVVQPHDVVIGMMPFGDTADTLAAMRQAQARGAAALAMCHALDSRAARDFDGTMLMPAAPEAGLTSTKAVAVQLTALFVLALHIATERGTLPAFELARRSRQLKQLPARIEQTLELDEIAARLAERFTDYSNCLYLGRGIEFPVALEGALQLKELSCIHAEAYNAGEVKYGPLVLVDNRMPVVVLAPRDRMYQKTIGDIEQVRARDGIVIAIASDGDIEIVDKADHALFIPQVDELVNPILSMIPLQLFAYHAAIRRGCDVDRPRNLAKCVAVE